ncbi:MAG: ABC transporter permease [Bacteroides sp.]|nr:ABC transporter permease [Bacteroides sp.]
MSYLLIHNVSLREWHRMTSRRLYLGVCLVLPLFCLFFMSTIFGNGQMENIPIGIVDQDNTATSRSISRHISAVTTFRVTKHFTDEAAARQAVQRKEIYGYLSIPPLFEQKAVTGTDATLTYYCHYALLSVCSEVMASFESALASVALSPIIVQAEALGVGQEQMQTFLLPIESSAHPLYNPDMDYSIYLSQPFFFILLQILILLVTVYAVGSEIKFGTAREWLKVTIPEGKDRNDLRNANILTAIVGKPLPYTLIFSLIAIFGNYILFGPLHIPFEGNLWAMNALTVLFIIATQALAVLIFSTFPKIAYIISIVSMIGSLGVTLSGVTFPVNAMYTPVYLLSYLFPVRHFTEAAQAMIYFNAGFVYIWQSVAILLLFPLLAVLILPLLKWWIRRERRDKETRRQGDKELHNALSGRQLVPSISAVIRREWNAIATNPAILLVVAGGIFMYGLLYNYMYAPNLVRKAPVAVVDLSHSALSREYIRLLDATPQASVHAQTPNILEARKWVKQGVVSGILYLPADFEARVGRGETSVFILYAATNAFLDFKGVHEASTRVMLALNDAHRAEGAVFLPPQGLLAVASSAPINVSGTALYNYTEGYGSYLIPAVIIVIIFQTMLMVIGMLTGEEAERRRSLPTTSPCGYSPPPYSPVYRGRATSQEEENLDSPAYSWDSSACSWDSPAWRSALRIVVGRTFVYVMLYAVFSLFLIGLLPHIFSIPNIGNSWYIIMMMIPYLLATSFFGLAVSRWFTDSEAPLLMIAFFSVGYIFLSGVSYPLELMPWYWQAVYCIFPVSPAVLAFVKLNSMGASLFDIWPQMLILWIQVIVYGILALQTTRLVYKRGNKRA